MSEARNVCEESVFEQLFHAHARPLRNFLFYRSGDPALADDLLQDTFLRLWRECRNVPFEKARSFLFSVARNLFLDSVRHEKVVLRFQQNNAPQAEAESPHFDLETSELQTSLEKAISALPENQRVVFLMNRMDDMTYAEIAAALELSVKAVEKRMHGALLAMLSTPTSCRRCGFSAVISGRSTAGARQA